MRSDLKRSSIYLQDADGRIQDGVKKNGMVLVKNQMLLQIRLHVMDFQDVDGRIQDGVILKEDSLVEERE